MKNINNQLFIMSLLLIQTVSLFTSIDNQIITDTSAKETSNELYDEKGRIDEKKYYDAEGKLKSIQFYNTDGKVDRKNYYGTKD